MRENNSKNPMGERTVAHADKVRFQAALLVALLLFPVGPAHPASKAPSAQRGKKSEPRIEMAYRTSPLIPIKEEVKVLRKQKRRKMPYLDRGYIKDIITKKSVKAQQIFEGNSDKTLPDLVSRAIEIYTPAKAAKERISLAKRRIMVSFRELLPGAEFNFELRKGALSADAFGGKDYHVVFKAPAFRGGVLWNTFLRDKAEYRSAKRDYDAIYNQMVDEVSRAYFELNRAREVYKDKLGLAERAEAKHRLSKDKNKQGLISEIEYLNVESMAGQVQYDVESAKQELELAKLELQRFLGVDRVEEVQLAELYDADALIGKAESGRDEAGGGEVKKELRLAQSLDEFVDLCYQNRPELQVEAEKLRAARMEEKIQRGVFLPRVDLTMEFGELAEAFKRIADDPHGRTEWRLALELSENVLGNKVKSTFEDDQNAPSITQFQQGTGSRTKRKKMSIGFLDGLSDYAELKEAEVKKLEQVVSLEKKEQEVIREVKEAYFDYHKAQIQVESSLKRSQYRKKLIDVAGIRLGKAEIEISEYLQAELDSIEERGRFHRSLADLFKAKSKLNRAIGIRGFLPMEERYGL